MTQEQKHFVATSQSNFPVTEHVMADILDVSVHWLRKDRKTNQVIPFVKMGVHLIRYIPSRVFKSLEQLTSCTTQKATKQGCEMSNGIRVSTLKYPDGERKFLLTVFLDDKDSDWVEFDKEQLEGLIATLQERLVDHDKILEEEK
jgi:hypothetical protein